MYERALEMGQENCGNDLPDPQAFLHKGDLSQALCEAELELYRDGVSEGSRSAVCLRLASRLRSAGYPQEEAAHMVEGFAGRCRPPLDPREARRITESAYRATGNGYQFGCGTGIGDPEHTRPVYEHCPYRPDRDRCVMFRHFRSQLNRGTRPDSPGRVRE